MRKKLNDYFTWKFGEEDGTVIVEGEIYEYEMTLSMEYADDECMRVQIDGEHYYFG